MQPIKHNYKIRIKMTNSDTNSVSDAFHSVRLATSSIFLLAYFLDMLKARAISRILRTSSAGPTSNSLLRLKTVNFEIEQVFAN